MRLPRFVLATVLIGCSSSPAPVEPTGSAHDASAPPADGGNAPPVIKSPGSVDGGVSAPCTDTSNCQTGLECVDGACFG